MYANVVFRYIEEIVEEDLLPEFAVCSGLPETFTLLRMQCKGRIYADNQRGPRLDDDSYRNRCRQALEIARGNNADIFLTPEYSFPLELITEILKDKNLQPPPGKIWCLGCQGEKLDHFEDLLEKWASMGAYVIDEAIRKSFRRKFLNPFIYVFALADDSICLIPQLKTHIMADRDLVFEGSNLTLGRVIFRFGMRQPNKLCTIICADSFNIRNIDIPELFPTGDENLILLHPQLNPEPRHDAFSQLRKRIFMHSEGNHCVYITANWAAGSEVFSPGSSSLFMNRPWSCIYFKNRDMLFMDNERALRRHNLKAGMGFAYWDYARAAIWFALKEENMQFIFVRKPGQVGTVFTAPRWDVSNISSWIFSSGSDFWQELPLNPENDLEKILLLNDERYSYPLTAGIEERDCFFGLCLGNMEEGQLKADPDEVCGRMAFYIDEECDLSRADAVDQYMNLIECLENDFPPHLRHLGEDFSFSLDDKRLFNLLFLEQQKWAVVAFVPRPNEAEKLAENLSDLVRREYGEAYLERVCVFTMKRGSRQIDYYPKFNADITAGSRTDDAVSIIGG